MRPAVVIRLVAVLVLIAGTLVFLRQGSARAAETNAYDGLRALALRVTPGDLGLKLRPEKVSVYGVILDMDLSDATATLAAYSTGDASVYLSTGGGTIGGIGHAKVREAARALMQVAEAHLSAFSPVATFARPNNGRARFFILTNHGVLTATVAEDYANAGGSPLSPIWYAGQKVLTELRHSDGTSTD